MVPAKVCLLVWNRQVGTGVVVTDGVYPLKTTVAVTSLDPVSYGALLATMSVDASGKPRVINDVILVVNPTDYLTKVMPATTIRNTSGGYVNDIFPFPTRVIQSVEVPAGKLFLDLLTVTLWELVWQNLEKSSIQTNINS